MLTALGGFCAPCDTAVPILPVADGGATGFSPGQWSGLRRRGFSGRPGQVCFWDDGEGLRVVLGTHGAGDWRSWAEAANTLSPGCYTTRVDSAVLRGWGSGSYRYRPRTRAQLCLPEDTDLDILTDLRAEYLTRFLIDHPANLLTTDRLARRAVTALRPLAPERLVGVREVVGHDLRRQGFPLIHAVGAASTAAPRLLEMRWSAVAPDDDARTVTIIGKGVCFDSGGLDIKPRSAMLLMKKDMGGAAHAIGLVAMLLRRVPGVNLRLILGIAENAISGSAMRPGDVLTSRNGTRVEVGDTDAEGRLILADCLSYAAESDNALLLDFATLTGAARVALGTDLPALFCNDDALAAALTRHADDPLWRLPLHRPYRKELQETIGDLNSTGTGAYGGAITAALFLEHFVPDGVRWAHVDLMAYCPGKIFGRAKGAAAQGLYACARAIESWSTEGGDVDQQQDDE